MDNNVKVIEGINMIFKSFKTMIVYIMVIMMAYGIPIHNKQSIITCILITLISFVLLTIFITEKTTISNVSIRHTKGFHFYTKEIKFTEISLIDVTTMLTGNSSYNYRIRIKGKESFTFGFISTKNLIKFISKIKKYNIKLEISENVATELHNYSIENNESV
jgi:hypothetical protein